MNETVRRGACRGASCTTHARRTLAALTCTLLASAGCAHTECKRPETITVRIRPDNQLNQDRDGYSRSLVLRLYQMASADRFRRLQFEEIWRSRDDGAGLDAGEQAETELTLLPGKPEERKITRAPEAAYLGIVGNFREHEPGSRWQAVVRLPPKETVCASGVPRSRARVLVDLANFGLTVQGASEEP